MNIVTMGLGKYGSKVVEQLHPKENFLRCVAICSSQSELENTTADITFRISTRLMPADAVERIHGKLEKACMDADMVLIVANPMDFANPIIIHLIASYIKMQNVIPVGIILEPTAKTNRKHRHAIRNTIELMLSSFASVIIPQSCAEEYVEDVDTSWLKTYTSFWDGRDTIQEQDAFHRWKQALSENIDDFPPDIQVGKFIVCRLLSIITQTYINADTKNILHILSVPGYLHLSSVSASGKNRDALIKWRATFNDVLCTSSRAAEGLLLTLTVPKSMTAEEIGKICLGIHGYASENVNFYFNINFSAQEDDVVMADVLATGTFDMSNED